MNLLTTFVILVSISITISRRTAQQSPQIIVQEGHLIFLSGTDKSIKFHTGSLGGVLINNIDLITTLNKARNATRLLENYQKVFASYTDRIDSLEQRVSDVPIRWSNTSNITLSDFTIRRLNRRLHIVLNKIADLQAAILEDNCADNQCQNGGTCQDMFKSYICHCPDGWQGPQCLEDVNECSRFVGTDLGCQNGATCINKPGTYECVCQSGFVGIHCTRRKADCSTGGQELCGHGTCVQQNNQIGYKCICDQGWTTDGTNQACIIDVNECNLNHPPCSSSPNVPCVNVPGSFYCGACPRGYTGNGYFCADVNECEMNNGGCSVNPQVTCVNTQGSRMCGICPPGYEGDGVTCTFRGVCNVNNGGCHYLAQCRDNPRISSTYVECICPASYVGTGIGPNGCIRSLSPLNPCASSPCVNGDCTVNNITGEYICQCRRKFTGRNCDIMKDPCSSNPCLNGGTCQNLIGISFQCTCRSGFSGIICETEARSCGGRLSGLTGVLKYPPGDYETYGHRISCTWTIETNETKVLNITFSKFDIEKSTGCRSDWLQIHDGKNSASRPLGRFCGTELPLGGKIKSTHNIIYLWFRSNAGVSKTGFQLTWNSIDPYCGKVTVVSSHGSIESPGSPGEYPPNRDCYWMLIAPFGKRLLFHFYSLDIGSNQNCGQDFIEFSTDITTSSNSIFAKFCNSTIPSPFYSQSRRVTVHFHSDSENSYPGFQLTYSVTEGIPGCGGIYTGQQGIIHSVQLDNPSTYLCEYKIQQAYNTETKITFLSLNLYQSPGCIDEYIEIREGSNTDSSLVGRYCGNNLPQSYVTNNQITIISSTTKNSEGWKIKYEQICGVKLSNATGSFSTPSASSISKTDCIYEIEQPAGYVITLTLKVSAPAVLYGTVFCKSNYIEVRDGDYENATLIKKICETETEIIASTHNHLWIRYFHTNYFVNLSFEATYTSTNVGCGGILRDNMGNIASPKHPDGFYPPSLTCTWVIIAPSKSVIQLSWLTFSLEQSYDCTYDNIQVFDNNTDLGMGGLIGKFCGFNLPPMLLSTGNIMTIVFTTDVTIHMDGFMATYLVIPESNLCGGKYYTSAGVLKTPNYPNEYSFNRDCIWTITVPYGQQILLNITDFELEHNAVCRYDYLEIKNGATSTSPLIGKYCGTDIPKQIPSHTNALYIRFRSDLSRGGRGFNINWSSTATGCGGTLTSPTGSIISPQYPERYGRNTDCTWKIIISAGSRIQVIFSDIDLEQQVQCNAQYVPDYIQLFDGPAINSPSLGKFCYREDKPVLSSGHQMLVKFRSDITVQGRGFQLHYSTICNKTLTGFYGVIESPNFPNTYPQNMNCLWDIIVSNKNKINITFSHFELEGSQTHFNKSCTFDYIEVKYLDMETSDYDADPDFVKQGKYCGTDNPGHITVNSDHAQIHFVSDKVLTGIGFRLEWQLFGCGGILTRNSGKIQSPNYPKSYPSSVRCEWKIEVDLGNSIEIQFNEIDIEKDVCHYDYIQIYNGPDNSSNIISKLCHQTKPTLLTSTGNQMFIEFQADYSYEGRGFIANYSTIPTKCGGKLTATEGSIFSPNYPKNFDQNDTCFWLIEVEDTHSIELTFQDADLPSNCDKNYIKVYDGPTEAYPVLKKVCGTAPNETINSTFNEMYIEFRTAPGVYTTKGFQANYKKSCGSRITTEGSGTIQISHDEFAHHSSCLWTIVSKDPSRHITLTVTQMQMHAYYCEIEQPVKIYAGETTASPILRTYCGVKIPPPVVSDGSAITIQLLQTMDFYASYSVLDSHCGGTFNSAKGFFASPGYPKKYASDIQCEWTINVASGNHIALSFIEFDILDSERCNTDFLEIRSNNISGPLLGVYCGKNKPENLTHEGTLWLMYKSSKLDAGIAVTAKGFYGEYELNDYNALTGPHGIIASPMYPLNYYNLGTFHWKITVAPRKRILLTFKEFYVETETPDDLCYFTSFDVYDGIDETAPVLKSICGNNLPNPIESSTNIVFIVVGYNSIRMGTKFMIEWLQISNVLQLSTAAPPIEKGCGSSEVIDMTEEQYFTIKSPGYPNGYKPNLNCEWIFSTLPMNHLMMYFLDVNVNNMNTRMYTCNTDYIGLYQKRFDDNDWQLVEKVCTRDVTKRKNYEFSNLLKVQFVTNRYLNGTGFKANIVTKCGGEMTGPTGYIMHSNKTYTGYRADCQWNVTVRSGKTIRITFEEMNISFDPAKGCQNYILLRNGKYPDSPFLGTGKYCGTTLPEPLNTTGNHLYIKYSSLMYDKGFKLKYQEISLQCGGEILLSNFDNFTEINSPNYPNIPQSHTECTWIIRAPPGESLRIDFEERFDLTYQRGCEIEYIELRDGGTEFSPLIGRYCNDAPNTQFSTDSILFVKFFTNTDDPRNGFKAKISLTYCGGTLRGKEGEIRNPSKQTKQQKRNCTWHISGPDDVYLIIKFVQLTLATGGQLTKNKITVFEDNTLYGNSTKLGEYTGSILPPSLTTTKNEATVNYIGTSEDKFLLKFTTNKSECGGHIKLESGIIASPGYPEMHYIRKYCQWTIEVPEGRRVTLDFVDFDLNDTNYYHTGRLITIYDGGEPFRINIAHLKSRITKRTFESSSNKMTIIFWSDHPSSHRGFKAQFSSNKPTMCTSDFSKDFGVLTQPSIRNQSYWCKWKHNSKNGFLNQTLSLTINLKANASRGSNFNCAQSMWSITVTNQDNKNILTSLCTATVTNRIVRSPFPITQVDVAANTQMNFTVSYKTYDCGGVIAGKEDGIISSPNYPNKPTQSMECAWLIKVDKGQTVNLTMVSINLGDDCKRSYIAIYNGELPSHPEIGKYCKTNKPNSIISQSNSLWIEYKYEAGSSGTGFSLKYEARPEGCGGIYHDITRIIQTPNYDKDYPNNAECLWEIRSTPGYSLRLQFIDRFHIEDSENCANDYVEVWDWRDGNWITIDKKCGRTSPTNIQSTEDRLKILFRSNNKTTASGFKVKWERHCGGTFEATKTLRSITSPGYPLVYSSSLNCVYNITTKADVLNINFDDFEIEGGPTECPFDNVTISGKYFSTYAPVIRTYCGTTKPPSLRMRGNVIITFKTDKWVNKKGFKFTYSDESCGGDINETTIIEAPNFTYRREDFRFFFPRIKCVWKIRAPPNQIVVLNVLHLGLSSVCISQSVDIYNGLNDKVENRLASLCGNLTNNEPIHSNTSSMLVRLDARPIQYGGFKAQVYFTHGPAEGCGGIVNLTETKYIHAPNLEDLDCVWRIIAPRDYQIQIHFTELNIPGVCAKNSTSEYYCTCSFVEVRDGGGPFSELMERLCSTSNQSPDYRKFTTSWNYGYIRFVLAGHQNNAFRATLTPIISKCGSSILNATKELKILTSPSYPNKYPAGIKCFWLIATENPLDKIELHFTEFNLTGSRNDFLDANRCDSDRLEIIEDPNTQIITEGLGSQAIYNTQKRIIFLNYNTFHGGHTFCGSDTFPFDYYSTRKSLTLTFKSLITSDPGKGFKLEYRTAGCNRNYTSLQGRIFSTNDRSDCIITITVPQNRTISLYFQKLFLSYSVNCNTSAFEVKDGGPNGTLLTKSCGRRIPNPVFSYTNRLYIHTYYKQNIAYMQSYDVGYTSTDQGRGCGGELYNYRGWVSSPLYPNEFRNTTVCKWKVMVPIGLFTALKFVNFDIQGSCEQTYVLVKTSLHAISTERTFCKDDRPAILRSDSAIEIIYSSSVHNGGTGWLAVFQGLKDETDVF